MAEKHEAPPLAVDDDDAASVGSSSSSDHQMAPITRRNTAAMMEDQDRSELVRIATALSQRRSSLPGAPTATRTGTLGDIAEDDPDLDPADPQRFDLAKWLKRFIKQLGDEGMTEKTTGVTYRNLHVFGSGEALQLQNTVGSVMTAPLKPGEFFSFGKKEHKQILHSFDGQLKPGELLIVLGRPGSGCSTLLKTICGELEGLKVGDESKVHYEGIPQTQMMKEFKGETVYNQEVRTAPALP